jgi:hypothetical protein
MSALNGYKTYIVAAIGVALVIAEHAGWLPAGVSISDNTILISAAAATIRHGVSTTGAKIAAGPTTKK